MATAAGVAPLVAGKPHAPFVNLVSARTDRVAVVVGDRPATDGLLAVRLDVPFALVFSGVTPAGSPTSDPTPAASAPDLGALVASALDAR